MKRVSARARRVASRLGSVGLVLLAAATALAFARPSARYATKPFARFTALRAASSADAFGIEAGEKIARVGRADRAVRRDHVPINTQRNLRAGEVQTLATVTGVVQVEPDPAAIETASFFSTVSAAG